MVRTWDSLCWTVEVDFVDIEMHLDVEIHSADSFSGVIALGDPDGIVTAAEFVSGSEAVERLRASPMWVSEPLGRWIAEPWIEPCHFAYSAYGTSPSRMRAERR